MKTKIISSALLALAMVGCSSSAPKNSVDLEHIGQEEVLKKHGDDSLKDADPFSVASGTVTATSMISVPGENRLESGIKMAQMQSKGALAHAIEAKLESFNQYSAESSSGDTVQMRELISETSKLTANDFKLGKVYYEKTKIIGDNGVPRTEWHIWAQVFSDEASYKRMVMDAIRQQQGKGKGFSAEFAKAVNSNWSKMVTGDSAKEPSKEQSRSAASVEADNQGEE